MPLVIPNRPNEGLSPWFTEREEYDEAIEAHLQAFNTLVSDGRLSAASLNAEYIHFVLEEGGSYPTFTRAPNAIYIFFGVSNPGLALQPGDFWANPLVTTIAEVTAAILNASTAIYAAIQAVTIGNTVRFPINGASAAYTDTGVEGVYGYVMPQGQNTSFSGTIPIPYGWSVGRARITFIHNSPGSGDLRMARSGSAFRDGATPRVFSAVTNTVSAGVQARPKVVTITGDLDLTMMSMVGIRVSRTGTSGADTFAAPIHLVDMSLVRMS